MKPATWMAEELANRIWFGKQLTVGGPVRPVDVEKLERSITRLIRRVRKEAMEECE